MTRVNKPFHSENTSTPLERVPGGRGMEGGGGGGGGGGGFLPHTTLLSERICYFPEPYL